MGVQLDRETIDRLRGLDPRQALETAKDWLWAVGSAGSEDFQDLYGQLVDEGLGNGRSVQLHPRAATTGDDKGKDDDRSRYLPSSDQVSMFREDSKPPVYPFIRAFAGPIVPRLAIRNTVSDFRPAGLAVQPDRSISPRRSVSRKTL